MTFFLTNTLSGKKESFIPIDKNHIKMYVCGPTVYDQPHIGNYRSSVVFDLLYRVLSILYTKVTYVRNITNIDDKIIVAANKTNQSIESLTSKNTQYFHKDLSCLNCLMPTHEPKATDNINEMIKTINSLLNKGHAYIKDSHVYFDVNSYPKYGALSKRNLEDQNIGTRIKVSKLKKNPLDFVLWKPKKQHEKISFSSPWGKGRPGWHIECSVMSKKYLGNQFDIHGGGIDLIFPHHENEIAQSICESKYNKFASYWIHNGFLTMNNDKMSKSLKNYITVKDLLNKGINGADIRYFYLTSHYKKPLNFNKKSLEDAKKSMNKFQECFKNISNKLYKSINEKEIPEKFLSYLKDDLNTPRALAYLHDLSDKILNGEVKYLSDLYCCCNTLGLKIETTTRNLQASDIIIKLAERRNICKQNNNWQEADNIRLQIKKLGYQIIDTNYGYKINLL